MSDDVKVCMLVWSYWPDHQGGAERQCRRLVKSLAETGVKCQVVSARLNSSVDQVTADGNCSVLRIGLLCPFIAGVSSWVGTLHRFFNSDAAFRAAAFWLMLPVMWLARLSFILDARRYFVRNGGDIDLIHVHESGWLAGLAVWLAGPRGMPVMVKEATFPSLGPIGYDVPFRRKWDRLRRKANFIAMGDHIYDDLSKQGISDSNIISLPNGVSIPAGHADVANVQNVLYVGNFSQGATLKAFDVLIDAWAMVHAAEKDAKITFVGAGDSSRWQQQAADAGCRDSMRFVGWVQDVDKIYLESSIFVLPSRTEGLSNALLEAQSWGLACVVSDVPGNVAIVKDGVNGLVVPVGDASALADALLRLLADRALRKRLGSEARRKMISEYEMGVISKRFAAIYRRLIKAESDGRVSA